LWGRKDIRDIEILGFWVIRYRSDISIIRDIRGFRVIRFIRDIGD
jgi:hypothetical protein